MNFWLHNVHEEHSKGIETDFQVFRSKPRNEYFPHRLR